MTPTLRPLRLLALVGDVSGCSLYRVWQPFAALQAQGYPAEWGWRDDLSLERVAPAFDAYLLPRISWKAAHLPEALRWFDLVQGAGKCVFYEADDDLFSEWIVPQQKRGIQQDTPVEQLEQERKARILTLQRCDGATVSSPRLATVVRQFTDAPVAVVPNALDLDWFRAVQRVARQKAKRAVPPLTVGWAGGNRPDADLTPMAEAWGRLARRYPAVTFVVQGHQPAIIREHVPPDRLRTIPWLAPEAYPVGLRNIDIGCAPLSETPFNRAKSCIKVWEYAASGAAVVASPTVYQQTITDGEDGYLCETADAWEAALSRLIEDEPHRRKLARRLLRRVEREHSLAGNAWRWPAAWASLWQQAQARRSRGRLWLPTPRVRVTSGALEVA